MPENRDTIRDAALPGNDLRIEKVQNDDMEIDLLDLLHAWRQRLWIIILSTLLCGVLGFVMTRFLITPLYSATSSIYVVSAAANSVLNLSDLNFGTSLARDYVQLMSSRTMMERVLEESGEEMSVDALRGMLSVRNEDGTRILQFTITSTDPEQAERIANAFMNQAIRFLPEVMDIQTNPPTMVDSAVLPTRPVNIRYVRNIGIGLMFGFILAAGTLTVLYLLDDTFDSAEDVERYLGVVPMAVVPENGQRHKNRGYYYTNQRTGADHKHAFPSGGSSKKAKKNGRKS